MFVYRIQPVVKPVVQLAVSCEQGIIDTPAQIKPHASCADFKVHVIGIF